jgi:hypothetical protein
VEGTSEHGNEHSGSIKGGERLAEWLLASQEGLYFKELIGWLVGWLVG